MQRNKIKELTGNGDKDRIKNTDSVVEFLPSKIQSEQDNIASTAIYKQLRPLLIYMRIFGLFFKRNVYEHRKPATESVYWYCIFINMLMVLNVVRSLTVFRLGDSFDHKLVQRILFTIWSIECTFKTLLMAVYCYKQNGLMEFFYKWKTTCNNTKLDIICIILMKKYIVLTTFFILANSVVVIIIIMFVPVLDGIYLEVIWRNASDSMDHLPFNLTLCMFAILNSAASMLPTSLFVILSFAIGKQFNRFTNNMTDAISGDNFQIQIEDIRLRHQNLCYLLDILDRIFSPMLAAIFTANIPMFCLVLYTMVTSLEINMSIVLLNLFWLCFLLLQMSIVSITAAWVNFMAHSPLDHIYGVRFTQASVDVQLQMSMFLSRLTGTQIGFTAMRLFVIDRPTILTLAGMVVTYFVLLVQFQAPVLPECFCNITGRVIVDNNTLLVKLIHPLNIFTPFVLNWLLWMFNCSWPIYSDDVFRVVVQYTIPILLVDLCFCNITGIIIVGNNTLFVS